MATLVGMLGHGHPLLVTPRLMAEDADAADGDRGALSPCAHDEARAGTQDYPYLLRGVEITQPNQVWAMDITYIPMARGFVYLAVVLDWFSRRVLAWRVSITMEAAFCVEALEDALARHGKPEIFNTDQGSQFTGAAFAGVLIKNEIAVSMDGRGAWRDNVFVERLWRSVKYEEVYLRAYEGVSDARASIGRYLDFYNGRRPHSSLDGIHPIKPTSRRCPPLGSLTPAEAPLIEAEKLFRQPAPALWHDTHTCIMLRRACDRHIGERGEACAAPHCNGSVGERGRSQAPRSNRRATSVRRSQEPAQSLWWSSVRTGQSTPLGLEACGRRCRPCLKGPGLS